MNKLSIFLNIIIIYSLLLNIVSPSFLNQDKKENYNIDKSISLSENADKIFKQKHEINFNKLNELYNNIKQQSLSNKKEVHITLCFNEAYHLLASVTIASILKNANSDTYIYFHIIALNNLSGKIMKKIFSLREKINFKSEFIFYNGEQAEIDFKEGALSSERGIIDYARLLIPELVDNSIEKIISLDIGNIIVEKDLYELYMKNVTDIAYFGVHDAYSKCFMKSPFNHKYEYSNGGALLLNIKKFKEINLYKYMVKMYKYLLDKTKFYRPYSDIMNDFLPWKCEEYLPLEYNMPEFIKLNINNQTDYQIWRKNCSYYYNKKDDVINAEKNIVIRNYENYPVYQGKGNKYMQNHWLKYADLTGFGEEIRKKYFHR